MEDVHPDTDQIIQNITQERWLEIFHQLTLHAESRCSKWQWQTGRHNLPKGYSPETIVNEAIRRWLDGERIWNHDAYPGNSPLPFLKSVVDSIVYGLGHSSAHKTAASLEDESKASDSGGDSYPSPASSPIDKIFEEQVRELVIEAIKDRPDVVTVFEHLWDHLTPAEIAKEMGIAADEVYAKIRFLRRRADEIKTKILGWRRPTTPDRKERRATRRRDYGRRNQQ
jgi:hypothetical protein